MITGDPLFSDLTFPLSNGNRVGLVVANGPGKSTVPGSIAGATEPTTGDITRIRGTHVGLVRKHVLTDATALTFYDFFANQSAPETSRL